LPLIYAGAFIAAKGILTVAQILLILSAASGARTIAFALNRIIDREIDRLNPRTATRELPSGRMTIHEAYGVLLTGAIFYFGSAALLSTFCLIISPIPILVFGIYPYMKRFTLFSHFGVGIADALGPMGGWFAIRPSLQGATPAIYLSLFTLFWVTGFDIIYATLDEEFDRLHHLHSIPAIFGKKKALQISALLHAAAFGSLVALFFTSLYSSIALPFLVLSGVLLYLEQKKSNDVELAFFKINAVEGFVVFGMVLAGIFG